jgi:hypothetical protein
VESISLLQAGDFSGMEFVLEKLKNSLSVTTGTILVKALEVSTSLKILQ